MLHDYILAAINREQLKAAFSIMEKRELVVFGTMDGEKMGRAGTNIPVYFYEPG